MLSASKEAQCNATALCLWAVLGGPMLPSKENTMAIVENQHAAEIPWRPGYRRFTLAGPEQGVGCSASLSVIDPGAGAPTHFHDTAAEVIILLAGALATWSAGAIADLGRDDARVQAGGGDFFCIEAARQSAGEQDVARLGAVVGRQGRPVARSGEFVHIQARVAMRL